MSYSAVPATPVDKLAVRMRRWPAVHGPGRWLRRTLWAALVEGFWTVARHLFAGSTRFGPPVRTFSVYQALRCGWPKLNGRIVLHDQGTPQVNGDSLLVRSRMEQHLEQPWPIVWSEHANARLVTESLAMLMPDKSLCLESAYNERRWRGDTASRFLRLPPVTRLSGNWTSIVSLWVPTRGVPLYGHWLHDGLPRLALLPEFRPDTRILVPANLKPYQVESLKLLGVWDRCRPTAEEHLELERYFFSSPVSMMACYSPYTVEFMRRAFLPKGDPQYSGPKRFFVERPSQRRPIENNEELCEFFRREGWAVVKDWELTFAQTVKLFSEAEAFCSIVGSNMSNVMFCPPGCTVMNIVPENFFDGFVDWLAPAVKANYHSVLLPSGRSSRMVIDLELIRKFFADSGVAF